MHQLTRSERRLLDAMQKDTTLSQIDLAELSGKSRTSIWRLIREFEEAGLIDVIHKRPNKVRLPS